jgi:hypothetical protein
MAVEERYSNHTSYRRDNYGNPRIYVSEISTPNNGNRLNQDSFGIRDFFIRSHLRKRKTHYCNDIKNIFSQWTIIQPNLSNSKDGLHRISWSLYTDIIDQVKARDISGKGFSHLNDKRYSQARNKYDEIKSAEQARNNIVSESVHGLENSSLHFMILE